MKIPLIPVDKANHFIYGLLIALVLLPFINIPAIAMVVTAIALGKELWDSTGRGTPEVLDALATMAGGAIPLILRLI